MNRITKNIIVTLIAGGIIGFGIYYRKTDKNISNITISIGVVFLLISYLVINLKRTDMYEITMKEFREGRLENKGKIVTNITQAKAIAMSEQRKYN